MPSKPLKIGCIVRHQDLLWKVRSVSRDLGVCVVTRPRLAKEVPSVSVEVLSNPSKDWPFVACRIAEGKGPVVQVTRKGVNLAPFEDWVPQDFNREGGSIFLNPRLRLRKGELLIAVHESGHRSRLAISPSFGKVTTRKKRVQKKEEPTPKSFLERLRDEVDFEV